MSTPLNASRAVTKFPKLLSCSILLAVVFFVAILCRVSAGDDQANPTPLESISSDSVNLTVEAFYSLFTNPVEAARQKAEFYLLGVLDSTEGRSWCDYHLLKTITIREHIFEYLKRLPKHRRQERASAVIEEALNSAFACRGGK